MKATSTIESAAGVPSALADTCSFEITARDAPSLEGASDFLRKGTELFVASVGNDGPARLVEACTRVQRAGFAPVPHIVARNLAGAAELDALLARLTSEAGVSSALLLGGDREDRVGAYDSALEILQQGAIQRYGMRRLYFACYPERHPRIPQNVLDAALFEKLSFAAREGIEARPISQFAFEVEPIVAMTRRLRQAGVSAPLHVGLAGPTSHAKLLRYALRCGIGPSIRILRDRKGLALNLLATEWPDGLFAELADAQAREPSLGIAGIHLFTFGALAKSAHWTRARQDA